MSAVGEFHRDFKWPLLAALRGHAVHALPRHRRHTRAILDVRRNGRQLRKGQKIIINQLLPGGVAVRIGHGPCRLFQQPLGSTVHIKPPRRKERHMPPLPHRRRSAIARLEHHERQTAFSQMGRRRQADRACANDGHGQFGMHGNIHANFSAGAQAASAQHSSTRNETSVSMTL